MSKSKTYKANGLVIVKSKSGRDHVFQYFADCEIENDGIGAYEYWGARCFDHGSDSLVPTDWKLYLCLMSGGRKRLVKYDTEELTEAICNEIDKMGSWEYTQEQIKQDKAEAEWEKEMDLMEA